MELSKFGTKKVNSLMTAAALACLENLKMAAIILEAKKSHLQLISVIRLRKLSNTLIIFQFSGPPEAGYK